MKSEYQKWWDNLNPSTREFLNKQPAYHGKDMLMIFFYGVTIGLLISLWMI